MEWSLISTYSTQPLAHPFSGPAKEQLSLEMEEKENVLKLSSSICIYSFILQFFNNKFIREGHAPPQKKKSGTLKHLSNQEDILVMYENKYHQST